MDSLCVKAESRKVTGGCQDVEVNLGMLHRKWRQELWPSVTLIFGHYSAVINGILVSF